jgi:hypothetical protein
MGRRKFNLTERNIYALDYNCNTSRALASGLYRPLWRRSDPSSARDCRHRARYSADSRQTRALSESVFAPAISVVHPHNRFCTPERTPLYAALGLHSANNVRGGMDHEGNHFFQTQDVIGHARFHRWHKAQRLKTPQIGCYYSFN